MKSTHNIIYLDYQATTPIDKRVISRMMPYLTEEYGNPASTTHQIGIRAQSQVDESREQVAHLIGARNQEIVFTSGATEANNLALKGFTRQNSYRGHHIITVATEHPAVLDTCSYLERNGFEVTYLPVDSLGIVDPKQILESIREDTILVSVMAVNNEIGVIQSIREIGSICRSNDVALHVDAAQAVGKIPIDVELDNIDLLSMSAHKIYGPKGIGALFVRKGDRPVHLEPQMHGGGHQDGLRSGTLPTALIAGFGEACAIYSEGGGIEAKKIRHLRDELLAGLKSEIPELIVNGDLVNRIPGNLNLLIPGVDAQALMARTPSLAYSHGSACTSDSLKPSHVLQALGVSYEEAYNAIRLGIGRFTTEAEITASIDEISTAVSEIRSKSPATV